MWLHRPGMRDQWPSQLPPIAPCRAVDTRAGVVQSRGCVRGGGGGGDRQQLEPPLGVEAGSRLRLKPQAEEGSETFFLSIDLERGRPGSHTQLSHCIFMRKTGHLPMT